ncbi:DUF7268 family protein [Haloarchaeobius sp. TZWWS8]|uniref:DUF7268 family protein n=1 Tax=Haloarchaeobius sp. TZWWS8 TaxID=3446121 RepID=UPI003EBEE6DE
MDAGGGTEGDGGPSAGSRDGTWAGWRVRARLVAGALGVGAAVGGVALPLAVALGRTPRAAVDLVFSLGVLAFGFGLLGWSGSIMVADAVEVRNKQLDNPTDWTERKSRRAMARIGGFGLGVMAGSSLVAALVFGI